MRWRKPPTIAVTGLALAASLGCLNEYHPEYSPRTSYSFSQNVSYPTTIVQNIVAPPQATSATAAARPPLPRSPARPASTASDGAGRLDGAVPEEPPQAPGPAVESRSRLADESSIPRSREEAASTRDTEGWVDSAPLRALCHAGDAESCRHLPGVHINGNVQLHGNIVIFGDVFVNDSVAVSDNERGH